MLENQNRDKYLEKSGNKVPGEYYNPVIRKTEENLPASKDSETSSEKTEIDSQEIIEKERSSNEEGSEDVAPMKIEVSKAVEEPAIHTSQDKEFTMHDDSKKYQAIYENHFEKRSRKRGSKAKIQDTGLDDLPISSDLCPTRTGKTEYDQVKYMFIRDLGEEYSTHSMESLALEYQKRFPDAEKDRVLYDAVSTHGYTHDVHLHSMEAVDKFYSLALVVVNEKHRGRSTEGGAGFRTYIRSVSSVEYCPYRDLFNGTYLVCCKVRAEKSTVEIQLTHLDFSQYKGYEMLHDHYIWSHDVEDVEHFQHIDNDSQDCEKLTPDDFDSGYWKGNGKKYEWTLNNCPLPYLSNKQINDCVETKYQKHVYIIGDSHMRYFSCFLHIYSNTSSPADYKMWFTKYVEDLNNTLKQELHDEISLLRDIDPVLILFDNNAWDMLVKGYLTHLAKFKSTLSQIQKIQDIHPNIQILFQQTPTVPDKVHITDLNTHHGGVYVRNNYKTALLNYNACSLLETLDIRCVPAFQMALPFLNKFEWRCKKFHILCGDENEIRGFVGHAASHLMLGKVCL